MVVLASQAASGNYAAATATISFPVAAAPRATVPTLSFAPIAAQTYGNPPFAVSATSASSGAVTYTIVSGPATIAGNMVTLTGAGTVVLSRQPGSQWELCGGDGHRQLHRGGSGRGDGADPELCCRSRPRRMATRPSL